MRGLGDLGYVLQLVAGQRRRLLHLDRDLLDLVRCFVGLDRDLGGLDSDLSNLGRHLLGLHGRLDLLEEPQQRHRDQAAKTEDLHGVVVSDRGTQHPGRGDHPERDQDRLLSRPVGRDAVAHFLSTGLAGDFFGAAFLSSLRRS